MPPHRWRWGQLCFQDLHQVFWNVLITHSLGETSVALGSSWTPLSGIPRPTCRWEVPTVTDAQGCTEVSGTPACDSGATVEWAQLPTRETHGKCQHPPGPGASSSPKLPRRFNVRTPITKLGTESPVGPAGNTESAQVCFQGDHRTLDGTSRTRGLISPAWGHFWLSRAATGTISTAGQHFNMVCGVWVCV